MNGQPWHGGSRYWRFGMWTVFLSVILSIYFDEPTSFIAVAPIFLGGAGATNVAERWRPQNGHAPYPEGPDD